eukprot:scaffold3064_cov231-Pinguiococcus_pyrenoidosus.AAC.1
MQIAGGFRSVDAPTTALAPADSRRFNLVPCHLDRCFMGRLNCLHPRCGRFTARRVFETLPAALLIFATHHHVHDVLRRGATSTCVREAAVPAFGCG